ncbi:LOG family protein [Bremerella sp. T1]|uniref:LOG family protein n=1 Tax=Bremerella sp. TYQ1 TaxID=3119568 RepID=UPI001CCB76CB|nr:LOG family protein [Bremerella volcania]UBM38928.1 LOG family protein [Bremerella volcania]
MDQHEEQNLEQIMNSPSYVLPELDTDFLQSEAMRGLRMQLEYTKPDLYLRRKKINSTIILFGGTQIVEESQAQERLDKLKKQRDEEGDRPQIQRAIHRAERQLAKSKYYDEARAFAALVSQHSYNNDRYDYVVVTGGGPGIMEAGNRGAYDVGAPTIGLNITLPEEQHPNPYITPDLCFMFHYFAMRKMHFLMRAKALVVFPGGFGTFDELFDALTLRQTDRMQAIPIILYGTEYWKQAINFDYLADEAVIRDEHLELLSFADSPTEAWDIIQKFHAADPEAKVIAP